MGQPGRLTQALIRERVDEVLARLSAVGFTTPAGGRTGACIG